MDIAAKAEIGGDSRDERAGQGVMPEVKKAGLRLRRSSTGTASTGAGLGLEAFSDLAGLDLCDA